MQHGQPGRNSSRRPLAWLGAALLAVAILAGCSGSGGSGNVSPRHPTPTPSPLPSGVTPSPSPSPTPTHSPTPTPTPTATPSSGPAANCTGTSNTTSIGASGGSLTNTFATSGTFTETFSAGTFATAEPVSLGYLASTNLPAPLAVAHFRHVKNGVRLPQFTQGAGNTYVVALCTTFGAATPTVTVGLSGSGIVPNSIPSGTQLNIAINQSGTWVDVATALVGAGGSFQSTPPTLSLPGITAAGTYLVYVPASGTNTAQINLGFSLIADDGTAPLASGLQFVQVEDPSGNALPVPTTTYFPIPNADDLDGEALTPDASHGAVVDGSNLVHFFSGIPQHNFVLSGTTVDITAYGADGDSIASLPSGDEVVASGNGTQLAVISGILSGSPVVADTINNAGGTSDRDGLVLSADGKVLLSRGSSGLDVFSIAAVAPHTGSTGQGTTSYTFTLKTTLTSTIPTPLEDGRDQMAISPADSSRAVVTGYDPNTGDVVANLLTGLPNSTTVSAIHIRLPAVTHRRRSRQSREPSTHRTPLSVTLTGANISYAVTITPDGTTAYVSTGAGIVTLTGVNTGTLVQSGGFYAPVVTTPGGPFTVEAATTIGVLPDGKYLVEVVDSDGDVGPTGSTNSTQGDGILIVAPIGAGHALGAPVGQLNQVVTPFNDQMITH